MSGPGGPVGSGRPRRAIAQRFAGTLVAVGLGGALVTLFAGGASESPAVPDRLEASAVTAAADPSPASPHEDCAGAVTVFAAQADAFVADFEAAIDDRQDAPYETLADVEAYFGGIADDIRPAYRGLSGLSLPAVDPARRLAVDVRSAATRFIGALDGAAAAAQRGDLTAVERAADRSVEVLDELYAAARVLAEAADDATAVCRDG